MVTNFISEKAKIGTNVKIWHFAYVGDNTEIGNNVKIGSLSHIDYNVKIGDDAWLGDVNAANSIGVRGVQDATKGYIIFGNSNNTAYIGRDGTNPITVYGTVDNDSGGFILQENNGGIQLIFNNGSWRIV